MEKINLIWGIIWAFVLALIIIGFWWIPAHIIAGIFCAGMTVEFFVEYGEDCRRK